jgi:hypothetical protein
MTIGSHPAPTNGGLRSFSKITAARPWMRAGGVFMLVAAVFIVVVLVGAGAPSSNQTYAAISGLLGAALLITFGIISILNRITLEVDTHNVTVAFWPIWKKRIPHDDIMELTMVDLNPVKFGGLGLRRVPGRTWALLFSSGPGLAITRKSDGATFYIRTDHANEAIAAFHGKLLA